ncbi:MAG: SLC13/DASS family transporter [Saprospiraceae bacterium]|nr:SLC13/DASS family transporter [Saprospiraceae bacterium]
MSVAIIVTLCILFGAILLFATELLAVDVTAFLIIAALVLSGVLTPQESISGFSNLAVATVAAMFVLSAGIEKSGALRPITAFLEKMFRKNYWLGLFSMLRSVAFLSAFVNNTPVVALFIPVALSCARAIGASPEKMLIPISFASIFGGTCTLIGTSTNILVSDYAAASGLGAFGMFEMTGLGLIFLGAGLLYLALIGLRLLPERPADAPYEGKYHLSDYVTNVVLLKGAASIGKTIHAAPLVSELELEIIQISRGGKRFFSPPPDFVLEENDTLKVTGHLEKIRKLKQRKSVAVRPLLDRELSVQPNSELVLHEVVVLPNSELSGIKLSEIDFEEKFGVFLLGVRSRKGLVTKQIGHWKLAAGDCLLLASPKDKSELMHQRFPDLFVINHSDPAPFSLKNALLAVGVMALVMAVAACDILPVFTAAILGCLLLLFSRIITPEDAYNSIQWKVIILLGGSLSLGLALEKTGTAQLLADQVLHLGGAWGPVVVLSAVYLLTSLLTEVMSNNATVVVLAPIVIALAGSMGVSPKPFLMAITFAASASFMTPIGYQTNTMVYAAGDYSFRDFFRIGAPLNILFWLLASWLIPRVFPF